MGGANAAALWVCSGWSSCNKNVGGVHAATVFGGSCSSTVGGAVVGGAHVAMLCGTVSCVVEWVGLMQWVGSWGSSVTIVGGAHIAAL